MKDAKKERIRKKYKENRSREGERGCERYLRSITRRESKFRMQMKPINSFQRFGVEERDSIKNSQSFKLTVRGKGHLNT
jgi:hypothetical protein